MTYEEAVKKMNKDYNKFFDIAVFIDDLLESWDREQLMEFAFDNLYEFYKDHPESLEKDYKLFMEDNEANHVLGY